MPATAPALLADAALAHRLAELAGDERSVQVEFLLHLAEYDRREAWLAAGYGSPWAYCRGALHLREGAAWRRIQAMRTLRRLPDLAAPLRDGRLCSTTVALLDPVLTEANAAELVARAAYKSKAEVEQLVVSLRPRTAPKDGVRRLAEREATTAALVLPAPAPASSSEVPSPPPEPLALPAPAAEAPVLPPAPRPSVRPVAADTWSLRVTVDAAFKEELDQLTELLSHKVPGGELAAVLREADGGCCAWMGPDGHRCGSRWRLEVDHIVAAALGGPSTLANLRQTCARHNRLHAEQTFGRGVMSQYRRRKPRPGEGASPGGSSGLFAAASG